MRWSPHNGHWRRKKCSQDIRSSGVIVVFPWWLSFVLTNPLRGLLTDRNRILTDSLVGHNSIVMEIGSGNGFLTEFIVQKARLVYAIELQQKMVFQLDKRLRKWKSKLKIINQDIADYQHDDDPVDIIIAFYSFHEIKNQEKAAINMVSSLKIGGHLCLYEPTFEVDWALMEKTADLFIRSGMKIDGGRKGRFTNFLRLKK